MAARAKGATVMLIYGAHLLRNGAAKLLERMMSAGWLTHLATNGAGTIHDWEYAWLGASTESVEKNVATGTFGSWHETATNIHLALLSGALDGLGYGRSLGRFIDEDGATIPAAQELAAAIAAASASAHFRACRPAADDDRAAMAGRPNPRFAPLETCVDPGAGVSSRCSNYRASRRRLRHYFQPSRLLRARHWPGGRARFQALRRFSTRPRRRRRSLDRLGDHGPASVRESVSCVNNLRLQAGRDVVRGHTFYVVDLQDGGGWDWTTGEPPKTNPAYYLRFCKSFSRMGGLLNYLQCDNATFVQHLHRRLSET